MFVLADHAPSWIDASIPRGSLTGLAIVAGAATLAYLFSRSWLISALTRLTERTQTVWDDVLVRREVPHRLGLILPLVVIHVGASLLPHLDGGVVDSVHRVTLAGMVVAGLAALSALLNAANDIYEHLSPLEGRSIKGYLQLAKILLFLVGAVLVVAVLMDRSPLLLLGGLGAMTAVLLLVFRDTILGLVASVQLASNDMVRVGDWIEVPEYGADGDVIDIALHTVKVRNWDQTITTIPTYKLIEESFRNWRGMAEAGGRRIKRAIHVDVGCVRFLTPEDVTRFRGYALLTGYLDEKLAELGHGVDEHDPDAALTQGARRLTNLGTFRAYIEAYLRQHEGLHHDGMTFLVRQLPPGPEGVAIEVYVFTRDTDWVVHEHLTADLFDHLLASLPRFDLRPFQHPTSAALEALALET